MSKSDRLNLLRSRFAIVSALSSVALSAAEVVAVPAPHVAPSRVSPILSTEERAKLSADVLADKISRDLQAFSSPAARGWLVLA